MVIKTESQIFFDDPQCLAACAYYIDRQFLRLHDDDTPPVVMSLVKNKNSLKIKFWPEARIEHTDQVDERIVGFRDGWAQRQQLEQLRNGKDKRMARDPERIEPMLKLLGEVWRTKPDLRLGQVIELATSMFDNGTDTFYIEDEDLTRGLEYLRASMASKGEGEQLRDAVAAVTTNPKEE